MVYGMTPTYLGRISSLALNNQGPFFHCGERIDGDRHSQFRWQFVRGNDKARLMGVAIAIDPFQVVTLDLMRL